MFGFLRRKRTISLEEQLSALAECGIRLREGFGIEDLFEFEDRKVFEEDAFGFLVFIMGQIRQDPPYDPLSDDIWHFDTECIYEDGDYMTIAQRLSDLAGDDLPVTNIKDKVDVEQSVAWLSFDLHGDTVKWDLRVDRDWVDERVFSRFAEMLERQNTGRRFTSLCGGGQDCIFGCSTEEQRKLLKDKAGLRFKWLK